MEMFLFLSSPQSFLCEKMQACIFISCFQEHLSASSEKVIALNLLVYGITHQQDPQLT